MRNRIERSAKEGPLQCKTVTKAGPNQAFRTVRSVWKMKSMRKPATPMLTLFYKIIEKDASVIDESEFEEGVDERPRVLALIKNVNCDVEDKRIALSYPVENAGDQ